MTREEAITVLKAFMENPLFSEVHKAAFNIAIHDIKAYQDWDINNLILINKDNYEPLEQEPTTSSELEKNSQKLEKDFGELDCISRQAVLDLIADYDLSMGQVVRGIHALPPVTPQELRWIPVSERLPETDDEVLCWYEYYHWSQEKVLPDYGIGCYFKETSAWYGEVAVGRDVRGIAWMPLQPYKAESEDKE